jgi:hypothetical protein
LRIERGEVVRIKKAKRTNIDSEKVSKIKARLKPKRSSKAVTLKLSLDFSSSQYDVLEKVSYISGSSRCRSISEYCRDSILDMLYCDIDECYSPDDPVGDMMIEKVSK